MTLIDPKAITPAEWQAAQRQRIAKVAKLASEPILSARVRSFARPDIRGQNREWDAKRTAERWVEYQANPWQPNGKRGTPVETIDGLEPHIRVPNQRAAAWICRRPPERMPDAMRLGHSFGGRKWGRVKP